MLNLLEQIHALRRILQLQCTCQHPILSSCLQAGGIQYAPWHSLRDESASAAPGVRVSADR